MCFSATASFTAGTILLVVGTMTLKKTAHPSQFLFAAIPMLFSIQQFAEGFVWLSLTKVNYQWAEPPATTVFLFFAQVVWPMLVPLSIYLLEKDRKQKNMLLGLTVIGGLVGIYIGSYLPFYKEKAEVAAYHIHYLLQYALAFEWYSAVLYVIPTGVPNFVSGNKRISFLGITIAASYFFTKIFFANYFLSVWCFFAAIVSILILSVVVGINKPAADAEPIGLLKKQHLIRLSFKIGISI